MNNHVNRPETTSLQPSIVRRLGDALEDLKTEGLEPSGFYLTEPDWAALTLAASEQRGSLAVPFQINGVQIFARHLAPGDVPERYSVLAASNGAARRILQRGGR